MKQIILDTSFIISCVKKKIDFFEKLSQEGFQIVVPEQTLKELEGLGAKLELKILKNNPFKEIKISGKDTDSAIANFAKEYPETIVATLDKGLSRRVKNKKMIIRGEKGLEIK